MNKSIIIFDSQKLFSEGISVLFNTISSYQILNSFTEEHDFFEIFETTKPDIVLMDILEKENNTISFVNKIKELSNDTKIIILASAISPTILVDLMNTDVSGIATKRISFEELLHALDVIDSGEKYYGPNVLPLLNKELLERNTNSDLLNKLTKREIDILQRVAYGKTNKEIAVDCHISERTVKNHLSSIFQKIEVVDRTQAAVFAIKTNLVQI